MDQQYNRVEFTKNERSHLYGEQVHLVSDPVCMSRLARLCSPECVQPEINRLVGSLYHTLGHYVANRELPRRSAEIPTRMASAHPQEGVYRGEVIDRNTLVVFVDLARAGMLPSIQAFEMYSALLNPANVRVDHIFINRSTDDAKRVTGAPIHASKIGGPVDDAMIIIPDPMGATGNSMSNVITHYKQEVSGKPRKWIALNLIVTPEYIRKLKTDHPEVHIYAFRLDRGFSSKRAMESTPGKYWEEEKGLNEHQYIVPGGGGFGEIISNAFV